MARIRTIKPEFFKSATVAGLPLAARLTFIGMWTEADDHGRLTADPVLLRAALWPRDERSTVDVEGDVSALIDAGLVERCEMRERRSGKIKTVIQVVSWQEHQKVDRRMQSIYEPLGDVLFPVSEVQPDPILPEMLGDSPQMSADLPEMSGSLPQMSGRIVVGETTPESTEPVEESPESTEPVALPQMSGRSPQMLGRSPQMLGSLPENTPREQGTGNREQGTGNTSPPAGGAPDLNFGKKYAKAFTQLHGSPPPGSQIKRVARDAAALVHREGRDPAEVDAAVREAAESGHANVSAALSAVLSADSRGGVYKRGKTAPSRSDKFRELAQQFGGSS